LLRLQGQAGRHATFSTAVTAQLTQMISQLFARPARAVSAAGNVIDQPQVGKSLFSQ
jgi:hypothetical protein